MYLGGERGGARPIEEVSDGPSCWEPRGRRLEAQLGLGSEDAAAASLVSAAAAAEARRRSSCSLLCSRIMCSTCAMVGISGVSIHSHVHVS